MRALLQILQLLVVFGLLVPPSTRAPALGAQDGESRWRSAQLERIALAHQQSSEARAGTVLDTAERGETALEGGDGRECASERRFQAEEPTAVVTASDEPERGRLALAHLRVNGAANAGGARA